MPTYCSCHAYIIISWYLSNDVVLCVICCSLQSMLPHDFQVHLRHQHFLLRCSLACQWWRLFSHFLRFLQPKPFDFFVAKVLCYWDRLSHSHWQLVLCNQFGSGHLGFIGTCGVQHAAYCTLHTAYYDMFLHRCVLHAALTSLKLLILNRIAAAVRSRLLLEIYQCHSLSICPFCCSFVLEGWSIRVRAGVDMIFPDSSQDRPQQMSDQIWSPPKKTSVG